MTSKRDDVETHGDFSEPGLLQVGLREPGVLPPLGRGDRLLGIPLCTSATRLHLAQDDRLAVQPHDVDLAVLTAPVALDDVMPIRSRYAAAASSPRSPSRWLLSVMMTTSEKQHATMVLPAILAGSLNPRLSASSRLRRASACCAPQENERRCSGHGPWRRDRGQVIARPVSLVDLEAVLRMLGSERAHERIARDLGHDRGRGHSCDLRVRLHDGRLVDRRRAAAARRGPRGPAASPAVRAPDRSHAEARPSRPERRSQPPRRARHRRRGRSSEPGSQAPLGEQGTAACCRRVLRCVAIGGKHDGSRPSVDRRARLGRLRRRRRRPSSPPRAARARSRTCGTVRARSLAPARTRRSARARRRPCTPARVVVGQLDEQPIERRTASLAEQLGRSVATLRRSAILLSLSSTTNTTSEAPLCGPRSSQVGSVRTVAQSDCVA